MEGCIAPMKKNSVEMEKIDIGTPETLASEMYRELKRANQFKEKIIIALSVAVVVLILGAGITFTSGASLTPWWWTPARGAATPTMSRATTREVFSTMAKVVVRKRKAGKGKSKGTRVRRK